MPKRPLLLDLFCGEGGAGAGYSRAGFDVVGIDIDPQPRYPFEFHRNDALFLLRQHGWLQQFDAIHASPPCQRYSTLSKGNGNTDTWPDLVAPVRELLQATGLPYVIENVEGSPLTNPVTLCGTMFAETYVIRHRLFETNWPLTAPPHGDHPLVFTHDKRKRHYGQLDQNTSYVQVTGGGNCTVANKRRAMNMPWASGHGCNEAIPPAYTLHVGQQLLTHIDNTTRLEA
jgi:DNA (cytosine-5)-methyltransferase 1